MADACFPIGGTTVNVLSASELLHRVRAILKSGEGAAIATLNMDHVVKLERDPAFRHAYAAQDLVTADGFPIVLAGRLRGFDVVRTPGSELIEPLAALAAELDCGIALIGATEDSVRKAAAKLAGKHRNLNVVLCVSPPFGFDPSGHDARQLALRLRDSGARLCFLAFGAPKQEIFAAHIRAIASRICIVSVGAGIDFISGRQTRAPRVLQALNLEWAWRLVGNPRRLAKRYAESAVAVPQVIFAALIERYRPPGRLGKV